MAVGLRRNPFGAQALFGYEDEYAPQPGSFQGFGAVPVVSEIAPETEVGAQQPEIFEPAAPAEIVGQQEPQADYVTEAQIEARQRLAKAIMGNQQEVNHPLQAVGNAVSQITGAWLEGKSQRDAQEVEKRRRAILQKAFGGDNVDYDAAMRQLAASGDPKRVDKFLEYQISKAKKPARTQGFKPTRIQKGREWVYVDENGEEIPGYGGPMDRRGGGGGGDGDGGTGRPQKGGWIVTPDGRRLYAEYVSGLGLAVKNKDGKYESIPEGSQEVSSSQGGYLTPAQWLKLKKERQEGINALQAIDSYAKQVGSLPAGYQRWAQQLSARWKTFLGQQGLTEQEFNQMEAPMKQQALLGMLRTTIVGPGVMTEYDAQRIIQAMGGDPNSTMQNPEVLASILQSIYDRKRREVQVLDDEYRRNAQTYGEEPDGAMPPPQSSQPQGSGQGGNQPPAARPRSDGEWRQHPSTGEWYHRENGRWVKRAKPAR